MTVVERSCGPTAGLPLGRRWSDSPALSPLSSPSILSPPSLSSPMLALRIRALALTPCLSPARPQVQVTRARAFASSRSWDALVKKPFLLADIGEGITECEIVKWSVSVTLLLWQGREAALLALDRRLLELERGRGGGARVLRPRWKGRSSPTWCSFQESSTEERS